MLAICKITAHDQGSIQHADLQDLVKNYIMQQMQQKRTKSADITIFNIDASDAHATGYI